MGHLEICHSRLIFTTVAILYSSDIGLRSFVFWLSSIFPTTRACSCALIRRCFVCLAGLKFDNYVHAEFPLAFATRYILSSGLCFTTRASLTGEVFRARTARKICHFKKNTFACLTGNYYHTRYFLNMRYLQVSSV